MSLNFEMGVVLGQTLEQVKAHEGRLDDQDSRLEKIEGKLHIAESWIGRILTAGSLWAAGTGLNLSAENVGQMIARVLRFGGPAG